ncbi:transmembrane protein, putative (macronuclear) [Tetrahymena thermophila SB210]|uniref:Transmembrane protein, putative n=1 Tax=Tetrahymena thermophila (strain SB210) TaxID=312017 RepID=Q22T52_TETTS|nr:transmembrane protein, putative [Tetrahymena thermophila SB210]EAR88586.1 transmembrane protein, putative [Tetrahymena thermophila SB210]|eukprot:XP_001008831.1 transmembrane protein, putative [Tetrahymena thermophila SB210]
MKFLAASILLILLIVNVSAQTSQKVQQCTTTAENAIATLCQSGDQDCANQLLSIGNCLTTCASGTNQSDSYVLNCAKTTCTTTNKTIQSWLNKFLSCLHIGKLSLSFLLLAIFSIVF